MGIATYETLSSLAKGSESFDFTAHLQTLGAPSEVAAAHRQLLLDAYWKHKDLPMVVGLATGGIHFCFQQARQASDDATRGTFKAAAKGLAYNLASFTWPGWDERGITITAKQQGRGFQGARLNLRLALDLQKPFEEVRRGAWLLGAHHLARGQPEAARLQFRYAVGETSEADYGLHRGYVLLSELLLDEPSARAAWTAHLSSLAQRTDEPARFAHDQLQTAHRVFIKDP